MDARTEPATRSPLVVLLGALLALGLARGVWKAGGLLALAGIVLATVLALTVGILVLRVLLG